MRHSPSAARLADAPNKTAVGHQLLVLWQHPETRAITVVGLLSHRDSGYSFVYTQGAEGIEDFRPLPGLPALHRRYEAENLPFVFEQRVMDSSRPDYGAYLHSLGIDAARATPWEQIVRSGGWRAGDTLQFMEVPLVSNGRVQARFLANGVRHVPDEKRMLDGVLTLTTAAEHEAALALLHPGAVVRVAAEYENAHDPYASLVTTEGVPLGYVPKILSRGIRELMEYGPVQPVVVRVGDPGTPPHTRLVLDLDMVAPEGFKFDREGNWTPLPVEDGPLHAY